MFRLLAALAAVAACLGAFTASKVAAAPGTATPAQCAAPGHYDKPEARKFVSNCLLCALVGAQGIASTYHVPNPTANSLARALANKTAPRVLREAVRAGCLRGFHIAASNSKAKGNGNANGKAPPTTTTTSEEPQSSPPEPQSTPPPHPPHEPPGPRGQEPQGQGPHAK